ncbi:kinase-like domain-containing protein [Cercophora newfieldiana]|uniref:Kinase-like domain-containing protein n=1 Tax=Cercophora newfieldiana TaxID=92897 RepID=A0AA39XZG0_9PEZI|nr:kinase-like domain-containing protein [Cercophora newfieldiana]
MVFLPSFTDSKELYHQEFDSDTVMPWHECPLLQMDGSTSWTATSTDGGAGMLSGGHSFVSRVIIHDGHYKFRGIPQPSPSSQHVVTFAVKKLKTQDEAGFNKEVAMLRNLGGKKAHTVRLLATFRHGGVYSLLFPWAECDLLAYWHRDLGPAGMSDGLIMWVVNQCHGLMTALEWIHNPGRDVLGPKGDMYGRHGDIKPENILWYKEKGDGPHPLASGQLVFSDFGLSSLNHKDTRSGIYNTGILCTTTYAPPESILENYKISQAIDIWALGCVFLEFATWIVDGPGSVDQFMLKRMAPHLRSPTKRDVFWELQEIKSPGSTPENTAPQYVAVVKPQVVEWIESLNNSPRATNFIRDFLQIIQQHMLVIAVGDEPRNRARATPLKSKFDNLKRNCDRDWSYYMAKANHAIENPRPVVLQPEVVPRHLSIAVLEAINRGSVAIPQFRG